MLSGLFDWSGSRSRVRLDQQPESSGWAQPFGPFARVNVLRRSLSRRPPAPIIHFAGGSAGKLPHCNQAGQELSEKRAVWRCWRAKLCTINALPPHSAAEPDPRADVRHGFLTISVLRHSRDGVRTSIRPPGRLNRAAEAASNTGRRICARADGPTPSTNSAAARSKKGRGRAASCRIMSELGTGTGFAGTGGSQGYCAPAQNPPQTKDR